MSTVRTSCGLHRSSPLAGAHAQLPPHRPDPQRPHPDRKNLANTDTVVRYLFEEAESHRHRGPAPGDPRDAPQEAGHALAGATGVTSRGAKCALVDHPIPEVRQELHRWVTRAADDSTKSFTSAYTERLRSTYADPGLAWGDAAVPDDTAWIADASACSPSTRYPPTRTPHPRRRARPGQERGRDPGAGEATEAIRGLHTAGLPGVRQPGQVARQGGPVPAWPVPRSSLRRPCLLLPEVAASGYGVICSHCRRTPAEDGAWPVTQYPATYLGRWTSAGGSGSLREAPRTISSPR